LFILSRRARVFYNKALCRSFPCPHLLFTDHRFFFCSSSHQKHPHYKGFLYLLLERRSDCLRTLFLLAPFLSVGHHRSKHVLRDWSTVLDRFRPWNFALRPNDCNSYKIVRCCL
jgi:hypothetical protein